MSEAEAKVSAVAVIRDETSAYAADHLRVRGVQKIIVVYIYDANSATNCCEITPSHLLYPVDILVILREDKIQDLEKHGILRTYEAEMWEHFRVDLDLGIDIYVHCRWLDRLPACRKHVLGDFDSIEDAIEQYKANPHCWNEKELRNG